jgi:plastocyanin
MSAAYLRVALLTVFALACSKDTTTGGSPPSQQAPQAAAEAVKPTGRIITIEMITDEKGNYYKPSKIEAHRGDVLRFVLKTGVHNVHFLADSNPGKTGLPKASELLQLPGQDLDIPVTFAAGHYYFQCDPHAALGMIGRLEVEDEDDEN